MRERPVACQIGDLWKQEIVNIAKNIISLFTKKKCFVSARHRNETNAAARDEYTFNSIICSRGILDEASFICLLRFCCVHVLKGIRHFQGFCKTLTRRSVRVHSLHVNGTRQTRKGKRKAWTKLNLSKKRKELDLIRRTRRECRL